MVRSVVFTLVALTVVMTQSGCGSGNASFAMVSPKIAAHAPAAGGAAAKPEGQAPVPTTDRKIKYNCHIEVVVKNLDEAQETVESLIKSSGGFIAKSEISGAVGDRRSGTWTIKIPVDGFRDTVNRFARLGTLVRNSSDSEDLTEEYLDLEARLRNLKNEEEVLNKLLKDTITRLDDVLKMREQIARIRGDIERAEGRFKFLASVTSYSTINLTLREIQDYVPPVTATFASEVSDTFQSSYDAVLHIGRGIVLFAVSMTPWLPLLLPIGVLAWRVLKRWPVSLSTRRTLPVARVRNELTDQSGDDTTAVI